MQIFQSGQPKLDKLLQRSPHMVEDVANVETMLAGPLMIRGSENTNDEFFAPLATTEPTLVASCSRGIEALNQCGGVHFKVLGEDISRASIFIFAKPADAIAFAARLPILQPHITRDVENTNSHVHFRGLSHQAIGSNVHVRFRYYCEDNADPDMATVKTQQACDNFMASPLAQELHVLNVVKETRTGPDRHPAWADGEEPQNVQVIVWAKISDAVCNKVLSCSTRCLNDTIANEKERSIRNGNFGCNSNATSAIAAMFIACGQNAASVAEASWNQFTPEYNQHRKELKLTMFFPSRLPYRARKMQPRRKRNHCSF
tara:strand:+ start:4468 stop:5415 length:948 start_codon:yes stop_codon:yes gene_type:complete